VERNLIQLAPLDWFVVAVFFAGIFGLGFSARLRNSSVLQFIAAGRNLTLPVFVATLVSTWYGGILGIGESASYYGFGTWLLLGIPYYVFALVYALFLADRIRAGAEISIPERLAARWGKTAGIVAAILVFLLAVPAAHVLMLGVLAQSITGWGLGFCVILSCGVGTLFLYRGGLLADVRVGMLAFAMMYLGFATILGWCLFHFPFAESMSHISDRKLTTFTGGQGPIVIVSFFILGAWTIVDPGFHQRVTSAESPKIGRRGVLISIACWFVFDMLSIGTAMYALALLKDRPQNSLQIYTAFGNEILPVGLKAIFFVGIIGTVLSAMVGYTLVAGASFGRDVVSRVWRFSEDRNVKNWIRVGFGVSCILAILLATQIESVVNLWYQWGGCVIGALLFPVLIAYRSKSAFSPATMTVSMLGAFAISFLWLVYGYRTNNAYLNVGLLDGRVFLPTDAGVDAGKYGDASIVGLGTLVPGLVISASILGIGKVIGTRRNKHG
jgi:SSS family solute:Na+ symporter